MSAMSLSTNSTEKYEEYDHWTPYSGTMTQKSAGWEYKSGKYLGESVVFYRNVPFDSRKKVKKHTVAYSNFILFMRIIIFIFFLL